MANSSSEQITKLAACIQPPGVSAGGGDSEKFYVHAAVSRAAGLYEKVRNVIDYKDEHLLRKAALTRILKRQLAFGGTAQTISRQLIKELIAAGYLPNGSVSVDILPAVEIILNKYLLIRSVRAGDDRHVRWLLGLIVAELEELFDPRNYERGLSVFLFESVVDRIALRGVEMEEMDRRLQIYIACLRTLYKADDELLSYKLIRAYHTRWMHPETWENQTQEVAYQMVGVEQRIRSQLQHVLGPKFQNAVKPAAVALRILFDVLKTKPAEAEARMQKLPDLMPTIEAAADERMNESKRRLRRGVLHTIIYLFLTKMLIAVAIEVPFEEIFYKMVDYRALIINVTFPPLLMLLVGILIRLPGKENVVKIQGLIKQLLTTEGIDIREVRRSTPKQFWPRLFLRIVYALMFTVSFGIVYIGLDRLHFTVLSAAIFLFFLCVVSFFAFRLRLSVREYVVIERPERFSTVVIDFFSYPILRAGQWLSTTVSRINILILVMDILIEAPFKFILNGLEMWFAYMREQKEDLQ
ncbi:hypothetical protein KBA73_04805 [Patescibacteria group bacterium]|nr:hypothetical protein [Patescibacteria group bacterium]